jgi:hypothetical protein
MAAPGGWLKPLFLNVVKVHEPNVPVSKFPLSTRAETEFAIISAPQRKATKSTLKRFMICRGSPKVVGLKLGPPKSRPKGFEAIRGANREGLLLWI